MARVFGVISHYCSENSTQFVDGRISNSGMEIAELLVYHMPSVGIHSPKAAMMNFVCTWFPCCFYLILQYKKSHNSLNSHKNLHHRIFLSLEMCSDTSPSCLCKDTKVGQRILGARMGICKSIRWSMHHA